MAAKTIKKILVQTGRYRSGYDTEIGSVYSFEEKECQLLVAHKQIYSYHYMRTLSKMVQFVARRFIHYLKMHQIRRLAQLAERENKADLISGIDLNAESQEVTDILIDLIQRETMNQSAVFAGAVVQELTRKIKTHRRPHKFAGFAVLKALDIPSILLEMGYLSNIEDENLLNTKSFQEKLAFALLQGLDQYFFKGQSFRN